MLNKFDSFSKAFREGIDITGVKHVDVYTKIGMDKGQFSNIYNGDVLNPRGSTRKKLTEFVDFDIKKAGDKWELIIDERSQSAGKHDLGTPQLRLRDFDISEEPTLDQLPQIVRLRDMLQDKIDKLVGKKPS